MLRSRGYYPVLATCILLFILGIVGFGCARDLTFTSTESDHSHQITLLVADLKDPADRNYFSTEAKHVPTGGGIPMPHTHKITLTKAQFEEIRRGGIVAIRVNDWIQPGPIMSTAAYIHNHTFTITLKK